MSEHRIPDFQSYEEIAELWDEHSLADYWDQTEPAELEMSPKARRHSSAFLPRHKTRPRVETRGWTMASLRTTKASVWRSPIASSSTSASRDVWTRGRSSCRFGP